MKNKENSQQSEPNSKGFLQTEMLAKEAYSLLCTIPLNCFINVLMVVDMVRCVDMVWVCRRKEGKRVCIFTKVGKVFKADGIPA